MLSLSIQQPWAELVVRGWKLVENRDWPRAPRHQGLLVIHTGQKMDLEGIPAALAMMRAAGVDPGLLGNPEALATGAYLGVVRMGGSMRLDDRGDRLHLRPEEQHWWVWGHEHVGLRFWGAARFEQPIPGKGQRGLYHPPADVELAALDLARVTGIGRYRRTL